MVRISLCTAAVLLCVIVVAPGDGGAVEAGKVLTWQGGGAGEVRFEGKEHAKEGHGCKDCHPGLFSMKHRTAVMTMAALNSGAFCGACHNGTAAFSTGDPKKCHECHRGAGKHEKHGEHKDRKRKHDD